MIRTCWPKSWVELHPIGILPYEIHNPNRHSLSLERERESSSDLPAKFITNSKRMPKEPKRINRKKKPKEFADSKLLGKAPEESINSKQKGNRENIIRHQIAFQQDNHAHHRQSVYAEKAMRQSCSQLDLVQPLAESYSCCEWLPKEWPTGAVERERERTANCRHILTGIA